MNQFREHRSPDTPSRGTSKYAHREDSPWHEVAWNLLAAPDRGVGPWAIPWPSVHEFLAVVTHPRFCRPPTPLSLALDQVDAWFESPGLLMLGESPGYWTVLRGMLEEGRVVGGQIHDARIAALCRHHGVTELWSADRDFSRFGGISVRNPLIA